MGALFFFAAIANLLIYPITLLTNAAFGGNWRWTILLFISAACGQLSIPVLIKEKDGTRQTLTSGTSAATSSSPSVAMEDVHAARQV